MKIHNQNHRPRFKISANKKMKKLALIFISTLLLINAYFIDADMQSQNFLIEGDSVNFGETEGPVSSQIVKPLAVKSSEKENTPLKISVFLSVLIIILTAWVLIDKKRKK